jgi:hypothetical protein
VKRTFSDGRRRSDEETGLCGDALPLRMVLGCNDCDNRQDWQGMNRNRRCATVQRDANSAAARITRRGCVSVSRFQAAKEQKEKYAT